MSTTAAGAARFCKLDAAGAELPVDAAEWVQVLDRKTGLAWLADQLDGEKPWKMAMDAAAACDVGGFTWRAPTLDELESIRDITRFNPAIDTTFFRCPSDWFWSASPLASSPASYAWFVSFNYGDAYYGHHDGRCFVRPVRSLAASGQ